MGEYAEIHSFNRANTEGYSDKAFSFVRWSNDEKLIVVSSFKPSDVASFALKVPAEVIKTWDLTDGEYTLEDALYGTTYTMVVKEGTGVIKTSLKPLESFIYSIK